MPCLTVTIEDSCLGNWQGTVQWAGVKEQEQDGISYNFFLPPLPTAGAHATCPLTYLQRPTLIQPPVPDLW